MKKIRDLLTRESVHNGVDRALDTGSAVLKGLAATRRLRVHVEPKKEKKQSQQSRWHFRLPWTRQPVSGD